MAFWFTFLLWSATFALSQLLRPDPDLEHAKPAKMNDFNFPTATEGRVIPLHWGTDLVKGPNVIWYGHLRAYPIHDKVETSLFNTKRIVVGHEYRVGFQMGICHGPAILKKIYVGDKLVWSGTASADGTKIKLKKRGLQGNFYFYTGSKTQAKNTYLAGRQSPCPAYRGLCYGVWQGGIIGTSPNIKAWSFVIERIPTGLGGGKEVVNSVDCNPMHMAYEIFTNTSWGYGYPASDIDIADFQTAATTLYNEGNGMSFILANQRNATEILQEIERQIDGHFRIDPVTGKWKCVLVRDGYSLVGLKTADVTNVNEVIEYSRSSWEGTTNLIRLMYKRRRNNYTDGYTQAQDSANMRIQGRRVPAIRSFIGVRDDTLANKLVWRELRALSYPFAKLRMKVTREFWDSYVGEVILFTWVFKDFSVTEIPFRITRIDAGNHEEPTILIDAVQDVFSTRSASFADQDATKWVIPDEDLIPLPAVDQLAFEAPYAIGRRDDAYVEGRVWCMGESQGRLETGYEIIQRNAAGTPAGNFYSAGDVGGFTQTGTLDGAVDQDDVTIDVLTEMKLTEIVTATQSDTGEYLLNLFMIGDEMIACTGATELDDGLRLTGCLRGFCDTAQAEHADTDKVWFLHNGGKLTVTAFNPAYNVDLRFLPYDADGEKILSGDVGLTTIQLDLDYRDRRPYCPTFIDWNSSQYPATVDIVSDVLVTYNRRDYRILNEYSQHHTDASTINGDFPANNDTRYRLKLYDGGSVVYTTPWNASGAAAYTMTFEKILRYLDGLPTTVKMAVDTRHTFSAVDYEALQEVLHEADVTSSSYDDDEWLGVCTPSTTSPNVWIAPVTGTYAFTIGTSIVGDVEARLNGGGWQQVIVSGNTTGNLVGVTAVDDIEVRHLDSTSSDEVLLTIAAPSGTEDGFGILVFA
ncbi:hypothetical protein KAR91_17210 [Candidatus Pacearchaeota archaeon]|nr:hypothetical protein [Candidatus Pacearchaeota archaeon]